MEESASTAEAMREADVRAGEGAAAFAAPVILLHGFAQTPRSWDAVADMLRADGHEVHVPDLYARVRPLSMDDACAFLKEEASAACASGAKPVVVGYSMGGRIALETLARTPNLPVAAVVLEGAGLGPQDDAARAAFRARGDAWAADLRDRGVEAFMDRWETLPLFASQRALPADARARVRADRVSRDAEELALSLTEAGQHKQARGADSLAALARAAERGVRVAYVHGCLDEKYGAVAHRVAEHVPAAQVEGVAGAGHNAHLEQPEAFARVVELIARGLRTD